jgi:hypothetical protein
MKHMSCVIFVVALLIFNLALRAEVLSPAEHDAVLSIGIYFGVPCSITNRLQIEESGDPRTLAWGNPRALGPCDSRGYRSTGLFQLNERFLPWFLANFYPYNPKLFNIFSPIDNSIVALAYLASLHARFGTWIRALWYYNCGHINNVPESTTAYALRIVNAR